MYVWVGVIHFLSPPVSRYVTDFRLSLIIGKKVKYAVCSLRVDPHVITVADNIARLLYVIKS